MAKISDVKNNGVTIYPKTVSDAVAIIGNGGTLTELAKKVDLPMAKEDISELSDNMVIEDENGNKIVEIDSTGVKVKAITDLDGNAIGGNASVVSSPSNYDRKISDFEPSFYSVKMGRQNNSSGIGTGWYERFSLLHITDSHQYNDLVEEALKLAQGRCPIICDCGDIGNANLNTPKATTLAELQKTKALMLEKNTGSSAIPYLVVKGNHDICNVNRLEYRNIMGPVVEKSATAINWGSTDAMFGYYDITPNSTMGTFRIVMLDPFDYADGQFPSPRAGMTCTFSQTQIDWFVATLQDAASKGYKVITMMHYSFGDNSLAFNESQAKPDATFYQDAFMIPDIITALQKGTALSKTYTDSVGTQNITVNISTSSNKLDYICHLFGHIHSKNWYQCQKKSGTKYDILMLGEAALGTYGNALNKAYRYAGTVNDIACSMLEIDTIEKCVYRVSYGSFMNYDCTETNRITKIPYRFS